MKVTYFKQKPSTDFAILDRINVICSDIGGRIGLQIYPFKVKVKDIEYSFSGLNHGAWTPVVPCVILAELDVNGHFVLTAVTSDMMTHEFDNFSTPLGIIMYIDSDEITIINHKEAVESA